MSNQVPRIVNNADTAVANLNTVVADIKSADLKSTVARVDKAVENVNGLVSDARSENGTLGQLISNKSLYNHIDATVVSADSLLVDLKASDERTKTNQKNNKYFVTEMAGKHLFHCLHFF